MGRRGKEMKMGRREDSGGTREGGGQLRRDIVDSAGSMGGSATSPAGSSGSFGSCKQGEHGRDEQEEKKGCSRKRREEALQGVGVGVGWKLRDNRCREVESRLRGERQRRSSRLKQQEDARGERTKRQEEEQDKDIPPLPMPTAVSKLRLKQSFRLNLQLLKEGRGSSHVREEEAGEGDVEGALRAANAQVEESYKKFLHDRGRRDEQQERKWTGDKESGTKVQEADREGGGRKAQVREAENRSSSLRLRERVAALSALYDEPDKRGEAGLLSPSSSSSSRHSSSRAASPGKWRAKMPQEMHDSSAVRGGGAGAGAGAGGGGGRGDCEAVTSCTVSCSTPSWKCQRLGRRRR
eukprot:767686-Hanusia_phi.AAC.7